MSPERSVKDLFGPCTLKEWSGRLDSNQRPPGPEPGALPGCATPRQGLKSRCATYFSERNKHNTCPRMRSAVPMPTFHPLSTQHSIAVSNSASAANCILLNGKKAYPSNRRGELAKSIVF